MHGLVNTRVDMLRYRAGDQLVAAATHGRGLFTSDVLAAAPLAAKAAGPAMLGSVYPNPFNATLNLELAQVPAGNVSTTLTDALGRRVFASTQRPGARQFTLQVPVSLAPGTYVLTVRANGQQTTRRITKQ